MYTEEVEAVIRIKTPHGSAHWLIVLFFRIKLVQERISIHDNPVKNPFNDSNRAGRPIGPAAVSEIVSKLGTLLRVAAIRTEYSCENLFWLCVRPATLLFVLKRLSAYGYTHQTMRKMVECIYRVAWLLGDNAFMKNLPGTFRRVLSIRLDRRRIGSSMILMFQLKFLEGELRVSHCTFCSGWNRYERVGSS